MTKFELLAPAGNLEKLKVAIAYGADACYFGAKAFSLRAKAGNLDQKEMEEAIDYCRKRGVKAYVTANIFSRNRDLDGIKDFLSFLEDVRPDGVIISDPGVIALSKRYAPSIPVHLSTQANTLNYEAVRFWKEHGVKRVNLARELSLSEIRLIREKVPDIELEVFVHGALCISYSGRCMLSLYLTGREANQGNCAHPCRYSYSVVEEKRPGVYYPVEEDKRGLYIFNSKDLCLIKRLPELMDLGVDSFKIEGRIKGILYVATVVRAYRLAINKFLGRLKRKISMDSLLSELNAISSRGFTENFFEKTPDEKDMLYEGKDCPQPFIPVAICKSVGERPLFKATYCIKVGDELEFMDNNLFDKPFRVLSLYDEKRGEMIEKTLGGEIFSMETRPQVNFFPYGIVRKKNPANCGK